MSVIQIPGYKIIRTLGVGGQATVYLAVQEGFDREVALKVMSPALAADPSFGERFIREAKIVANLSHHNIVTVYDVGQSGNYYYLAMEYLPGQDLKTRIHEGIKTKDCLEIVSILAKALHFAHAKGYIHRDVKSENILFDKDDRPLLTDFGIAKASNSSTQMTQTGKLIGTPEYMSPEQCRGKTVDGRSDLYSLGIILFEMLTRNVPFTGEDSVAVCIKHVTKPIPELPARLNHIQWLLQSLLVKDPGKRFQSGEQLSAAIDEFKSGGYNSEGIKDQFSITENLNKETQIIDTEGFDEFSGFDDLHTETRPQISEIHPKSRLPGIIIMLSLVAIIVGGYLSKDNWYPQVYQWVQVNLLNNNAITAAKTDPSDEMIIEQSQKTNTESLTQQESLSGSNQVQEKPLSVEKLLQDADVLIQFKPQKIADIKQALKLIASANTLQPNNKNIKLQYQNILNVSLSEAANFAEKNKFEEAQAWLALVEYEEPQHQQLIITREHIQRLQDTYVSKQNENSNRQQEINQLFQQADLAYKEKRLSSPKDNNAIYYFQQVMALEPNNEIARAGLDKIAEDYINLVDVSIKENTYSKAKTYLSKFSSLSNDETTKLRLRQKISKTEKVYQQKLKEKRRLATIEEEKRQKEQARLDNLNDPLVQLKLQGNLEAAKTLEQQQLLIEPEENNALQKYRNVLQIDEKNADANAGIQRIESMILKNLTSAIESNHKADALEWLRQLALFDKEHPELTTYQQSVNNIVDVEPAEKNINKEKIIKEEAIEEPVVDSEVIKEKSKETQENSDLLEPLENLKEIEKRGF